MENDFGRKLRNVPFWMLRPSQRNTRPSIENEQGKEVLVVCGKKKRHEKNPLKEWENELTCKKQWDFPAALRSLLKAVHMRIVFGEMAGPEAIRRDGRQDGGPRMSY